MSLRSSRRDNLMRNESRNMLSRGAAAQIPPPCFAPAAGTLLVGGCLGGCWGRQSGRLGPCLFGFVGLLSCFVLVCLVGVVGLFFIVFSLLGKDPMWVFFFHLFLVFSWIVGAWRSLFRWFWCPWVVFGRVWCPGGPGSRPCRNSPLHWGLLAPFWSHFWSKTVMFLRCFFRCFFECFFYGFWVVFGVLLRGFWTTF